MEFTIKWVKRIYICNVVGFTVVGGGAGMVNSVQSYKGEFPIHRAVIEGVKGAIFCGAIGIISPVFLTLAAEEWYNIRRRCNAVKTESH